MGNHGAQEVTDRAAPPKTLNRSPFNADTMTINGYKPISDYGVIGNLRTAAVVGLDGSIDWACFPEMDHASVFAALLDAQRGGRFRIAPVGMERGEQRYVENTNVLETIFDADGGRLTVTDLMPLRGDIDGHNGSDAPPEIHRILHCEGGALDVEIEWTPRLDYARATTEIRRTEGGWLAEADGEDGRVRLVLGGLEKGKVVDDGMGPSLRARLRMQAGERRPLVMRWDTAFAAVGLEASMEWLRDTVETWRGWVHTAGDPAVQEWAGTSLPLVTRSELVLKLLTYSKTGAIAAAATTSLPETIGGIRNWDYRYCWIRDASLTVQALIALGHQREAIEFILWSERSSQSRCKEAWHPQLMYGLRGEPDLDEFELNHFEGYRGSSPVRIGNAAAEQLQLDIYGELLNSAYELVRRGVEMDASLRDFLTAVADHACTEWDQPDHGIWEVRGDEKHYTYSKVMVWLALERAADLATRAGIEGNAAQWRRTAAQVREETLRNGYDPEVGAFVQHFGSKDLDAANLLLPFYEMLPYEDPRVQSTIDRTLEKLTTNGLVYRYHADDGLPGEEGAFGLCTFWLVDALALSGRMDEAWEIYEGLAGRANHVGLFSEQVDPSSGEFLGNFPQAFTHIGLINSRLYLAHGEGKHIPGPPLQGTPEHRIEIISAGGEVAG
jgi:GH15 family glucan-1,4-alpha-glucosidase